jgi:hypothetical protein
LNISLADTTIAFFDTKYTYDLWRPVTAIQTADTDNNPATAQDPAWIPLSTKTAPDPSFPAHTARPVLPRPKYCGYPSAIRSSWM